YPTAVPHAVSRARSSALCAPGASRPSLHDALPIWGPKKAGATGCVAPAACGVVSEDGARSVLLLQALDLVAKLGGALVVLGLDGDRKSTRLNSSHVKISYAVFCLKKKSVRHAVRHV